MNGADTTSIALPVAGGLVAAVLFAVANNVQRHAASAVPHGHVGPVGLLLRLLRNPRWLAGSSAAVLALVVQAWALSQGGVILVQAVIASTLVWSLALECVVERRRPTPTQTAGAALVAVGISVLVLVGRPGAGGEFHSLGRAAVVWAVVGVVGAARCSCRGTGRGGAGRRSSWARPPGSASRSTRCSCGDSRRRSAPTTGSASPSTSPGSRSRRCSATSSSSAVSRWRRYGTCCPRWPRPSRSRPSSAPATSSGS